jgi:hypothetical protein
MGIAEVVTAVRAPWQNVYAERVIGSIRRECLDHLSIGNERGLRRVLHAYVQYDLKSRTHLSLRKDAPSRNRSRRRATGRSCVPTLRMPFSSDVPCESLTALNTASARPLAVSLNMAAEQRADRVFSNDRTAPSIQTAIAASRDSACARQ